MTNPTPHGQVPEALIDLIDAYAETRHRCGGIYNAKTEAARKAVIEALSGVQALSAAPADVEDAIAWLVTWKGGEHTYVHAHASELPAVTQARVMGGTVTPCVAALAASPTPPAEQQARWVERWHGSGGKEFWEGWSILNAANREMIAHLGPDVGPDAVRGIVAAHNEALCGECAGTGGRWCPACAGATPSAEQQAAPKAAPGEQNAVSAEWLEQAYREGWAACRDAETIGEEAEDWAFGNSTANSRMIDAQQEAPKAAPGDSAASLVVPDGCPHILWFDDQDLKPVVFAGNGAKRAALEAYRQASMQWNAHLFVRIAVNSRDCLYPCAAPQQEAQEPAAYIHVPHHTVEGKVRPVVSFEKYQQDYSDGIYSTRIPLYTAPKQEAQEPCQTCIAMARTVMMDQVSFDRKPDAYGIRQITDDDGVEDWEDIRTSPDVAREEANDMMATGRGEIYEVVPLWTTPQPSLTAKAADSVLEDAMAWPKPGPQNPTWTICPKFLEKIMRSSASEYMPGLEEIEAVLLGLRTLFSASRVDLPGWESWPPDAHAADSVLEDAARLDWLALAGPVSICVVIDRPHDGEVEVSTDDVTGYGKTLREAIDAAIAAQGGA